MTWSIVRLVTDCTLSHLLSYNLHSCRRIDQTIPADMLCRFPVFMTISYLLYFILLFYSTNKVHSLTALSKEFYSLDWLFSQTSRYRLAGVGWTLSLRYREVVSCWAPSLPMHAGRGNRINTITSLYRL